MTGHRVAVTPRPAVERVSVPALGNATGRLGCRYARSTLALAVAATLAVASPSPAGAGRPTRVEPGVAGHRDVAGEVLVGVSPGASASTDTGYLGHHYWTPTRAGSTRRSATWTTTLRQPGRYRVLAATASW
jgi:hypothetical protein